jgi:hypothetical protein
MKDAFKHWRGFLTEWSFSDTFKRVGDANTSWEIHHVNSDLGIVEEECEEEDIKSIASKAHSGQTRRGGEPYITHPQATVALAKKFGYGQLIVDAAYLHDTLEDATNPADIEKMIQSTCPEALPLVKQLTHSKDVAYGDYVLSLSPDALAVKLLDMHHNSMDLDPDSKQYQKYRDALKKLQDMHGGVPAGVKPAHWGEISAKFELAVSMEAITERWRTYSELNSEL